MSKKQQVLVALYEKCKRSGNFVFHNDVVKDVCREVGFGNPFDATKFDNSGLLPDLLRDDDVYVEHLGKGKHRFVKGIQAGFHVFEEIYEDERDPWKYRPSLLNEYDTSESNILSVGFNQRVLHDFLYEDASVSPHVHNGIWISFIGNYTTGGQSINVLRRRMKLGLVLVMGDTITIVKGDSGVYLDFSVDRIFLPWLYFVNLMERNAHKMREVQCCYLLRHERNLCLYRYGFQGAEVTSLRLLQKREYLLQSAS